MQIDYHKELNEQQYDAVSTTEGPVLIIAGAGSGKTRVLTYRVAYLIEHGVFPEGILLLTFTNKAAKEMKARAMQMLDERCQKITACTYHSFCAKIMRKYASVIGFDNNYTILDSSDAADVITMMKTELQYTKMRGFPNSKAVVSIISSSVNLNQPIATIIKDKYSKYINFIDHVIALKKAADSYKQKNSMMDYDDILVNFLRLIKTNPLICDRISVCYSHIMVDEYQDSNYLQEQIVLELRKKNRNLCVVGDDAQSIYGFRGSNVNHILKFPQKMEGCKTVYLTMNYRSNQEIMNLSNDVMKKNATEGYPKIMQATHFKNDKPKLIHIPDVNKEADYILNDIIAKHSAGIPYNEICVLFRSSYESYQLEERLNSYKIPYDKYGGLKFFDKAHIKDILAYIRCLTNVKDEIAWFRILKLHPGIGKTYSRNLANAIISSDRGMQVLLKNQYSSRSFQKDLSNLYELIVSLFNMNMKELMNRLTEFYMELRKNTIEEMNTSDENRDTLLTELIDIAGDLAIFNDIACRYDNPVSFLEDMSLNNNPESEEIVEDAVVLSTIHSAKGLEFNTVYVMNCVDSVFPSTTEFERGSQEDNEELRCFYVAITRAKENLIIMIPEIVTKYADIIPGILSHYLTESLNFLS